MAPMIDMVFLLLVFFMCVSSLAQADKGVEVDLPESSESEVPDNVSNRGIISVKEDGRVFLGGEEISPEDLGPRIADTLRKSPRLRIQVRADRQTRFKEIQGVLKTCAEAGAVDVIYSTHQAR